MSLSGIYGIIHRESGKIYVGSAVDTSDRWYQHRWALAGQRHISKHLQSSWNKYGADAFEWKILEEVPDRTKLIEREQYWIDFFRSYLPENGYNTSPTAGNTLGMSCSAETKRKIGNANRGKDHLDSVKKAIQSNIGRKHRFSTIQKHKEDAYKTGFHKINLGKRFSDAHRAKISLSNTGKVCHWKGKTHTDTYKKKMSESLKEVWAKKREIKL